MSNNLKLENTCCRLPAFLSILNPAFVRCVEYSTHSEFVTLKQTGCWVHCVLILHSVRSQKRIDSSCTAFKNASSNIKKELLISYNYTYCTANAKNEETEGGPSRNETAITAHTLHYTYCTANAKKNEETEEGPSRNEIPQRQVCFQIPNPQKTDFQQIKQDLCNRQCCSHLFHLHFLFHAY